jgi:hypothetical protein
MEELPKKQSPVGRILLFVMVVVSMLIMFSIFYYLEDWREEHFPEENAQTEDVLTSGMLACVEMGCPAGSKFLGSTSGTTYHSCATTQARSIKRENRICFSSASDASVAGYTT